MVAFRGQIVKPYNFVMEWIRIEAVETSSNLSQRGFKSLEPFLNFLLNNLFVLLHPHFLGFDQYRF